MTLHSIPTLIYTASLDPTAGFGQIILATPTPAKVRRSRIIKRAKSPFGPHRNNSRVCYGLTLMLHRAPFCKLLMFYRI